MKVVAFNGSPRADGNTAQLIRVVLNEIEEQGIQTELIQLGGLKLRGCTACYGCMKNQDQHCIIADDEINLAIDKMLSADGIIIGSPTYFSNVSTEIKALIDRAGLVAKLNGDMFRRKIGAAVVAVRRAGSIHAFNSINHFFLINQMIVPGSSYWNMGIGLNPGDVADDDEGLLTMKNLGINMAWLIKQLDSKS